MSANTSTTLASGFRYAALAAGIKASKKLDLTLVVGDQDLVAAGVYTQNLVRAASIDWCRGLTPSASIRAVVVNSGNANACTGEIGKQNNRRLAESVGQQIGCRAEQVLVLSTGVIGKQLPMATIEAAMPRLTQGLQFDHDSYDRAADGITTTDNARKTAGEVFEIGGVTYCINVMAKGAGMIGPNMATMLAVVTTDFPLSAGAAQSAIVRAANHSFNRISVEGHTSTNDALVFLSSAKKDSDRLGSSAADIELFSQHLDQACLRCAKLIPADGEGATHLIQISVKGTDSDAAADTIARAVANSALVKTAAHGNDPNWGRIVSAAGYAGVAFEADQVSLEINGTKIFANGAPLDFDAAKLSQSMKSNFDLSLDLRVGSGQGQTIHYTSDLTMDYVRFNADYHT